MAWERADAGLEQEAPDRHPTFSPPKRSASQRMRDSSVRSSRRPSPDPPLAELRYGGGATAGGGRRPRGGAASRISRAKLCVCGASSQLGRERSRLLKVEQMIMQRLQRLTEREEAFKAFDEKIRRREEELSQQQEEHRIQELDLRSKIDATTTAILRAEERCEAVKQREQDCEARRRDLLRQQQRVQKRLERVAATQHHLSEDRHEIVKLQAERDNTARTLEDLRRGVDLHEREAAERHRELKRLEVDVGMRRSAVKRRQEELEPVQADLQAKEADLNERQALLDRRRAAIAEREAHLEKCCREIAETTERTTVVQKSNEEVERRLERLWDDIHQRQLVLEDLDRSLHGRHARVTAAEHSRVVRDGRSKDVDELETELMAAELSDKAWRDRSAALSKSEAELRARVQLLEDAAPYG